MTTRDDDIFALNSKLGKCRDPSTDCIIITFAHLLFKDQNLIYYSNIS